MSKSIDWDSEFPGKERGMPRGGVYYQGDNLDGGGRVGTVPGGV